METTRNVATNASVRGLGRKRLTAIGLLLFVVASVACSGGDSGDVGAGSSGDGEVASEARQLEAVEEDGRAGGASAGGDLAGATGAGSGSMGGRDSDGKLLADMGSLSTRGGAARLPSVGPSVIKTATVDIGVPDEDVDESINEAISVAGRYGGFVLSSRLGRRDAGGTLTMRIPATRFEAALADLEGLGKVRRENISGEDVGQEFVDLQARLRNWESQEAVLLKLMDRAESVTDTIRVQNELSRVQMEVEQLRGRLTFLRDQTSMGTITATFGPLTPPKPDAPSRFAQAWSRAVDLMQSFVAGMIVTLGVVVPLTVIALVLYLIFRGLRPRLSA